MHPLIQLFVRIARGEKLGKATPQDYKLWFGFLALFPVFVGGFTFLPLGKRILDQGSIAAIWTYMVVTGVLGWIALLAWIKWVPASASLLIAVLFWGLSFWLMWSNV